ncbi:MAG: type II secretion system protein N [Halothiobacillus sp.]
MSRAQVKPTPMRRKNRIPRLAGAGFAVFGVSLLSTLLVTAPITLVRLPANALPAGMQLTPVSGTFWHGQWALVLPNTAPLRVTTDFLPWALWRLQPTWAVQAQGEGVMLQANVTADSERLSLARVQARLAAASPSLRALTAWPLGGTFQIQGDADFLRTPAGWALHAARGSALWQNAQITTAGPLALGDVQFTATVMNQQLTATLAPQATATAPLLGELTLSSLWPIKTAPQIHGNLQPTPQAGPALRQQLSLLGQPDANGTFIIQGVLPGRY